MPLAHDSRASRSCPVLCIGARCRSDCFRKTAVERLASPRRKQATAWSGGAELSGREDPEERAGGDDADAVASGPARRPDPGGLGTPTLRALILSRNSALE